MEAARGRRNLTAAQLSRLAGLEESYCSQVETGRRKQVRTRELLAVARVLGVRPEWLTNGEEPMHDLAPTAPYKANLEKTIESLGPVRLWSAEAIGAARGFSVDLTLAEWPAMLDRLDVAIAQVVAPKLPPKR